MLFGFLYLFNHDGAGLSTISAKMLKIPPVFLHFLPVLCTKAIGAASDKH
jgi:hypothetical protein